MSADREQTVTVRLATGRVRAVALVLPEGKADSVDPTSPGSWRHCGCGRSRPRASRRFADRAATAGADVTYRPVHGEMHAMVFRWRLWHRLAATFTCQTLGLG